MVYIYIYKYISLVIIVKGFHINWVYINKPLATGLSE